MLPNTRIYVPYTYKKMFLVSILVSSLSGNFDSRSNSTEHESLPGQSKYCFKNTSPLTFVAYVLNQFIK